MAKITVLGGCGAVGSVAVRTLAAQSDFSEVVIGDANLEKAQKMAIELGSKVSAARCDAFDVQSIKNVVLESDIVLNCVGPFYSTVKPVLQAVLKAGIKKYVDVCDDVDVTLDLLKMHAEIREAGLTALIGMGSSPGVTNILAKYAADFLLDTVISIDIFHTHGGEPVEGEGVIAHRFHCMSIPIPMYLKGELKYVNYFEPEGVALRQTFNFPYIGETIIYPYPHPEQVTLPNCIQLQQVTNKGSVLPEPYYTLISDLCRLGLDSREPMDVKGHSVVPYDFAIAYILRERERILQETQFGIQRGCVSVIAKGYKNGEKQEYRFHMASTSQALGEGTGIPAAIGAILMQQGKVFGPGVLPPEAGVKPADFLQMVAAIMMKDTAASGTAFEGVIVERVDEGGAITRMKM